MVYRRSFSHLVRLWWMCVLALALAACATVRPEERGNLAHPSMTYGADGLLQAQEEEVFSNREGATGGGKAVGGGCGCN